MWFSKNHFQPEGKLAVIIGASQGVGADLALKLYERDCSVIIVARTEAKLKNQIQRIENSIGSKENTRLSYITSDVSKYEECEKLWQKILIDSNQDPDFIFCCAGSSIPKLFQDLTGSDISDGITTNYNTSINVIQTGFKKILLINDTLNQKPRHIIFFSSVVSFFPFIGYSQYAPLKAAIQSLSTILRQEMSPYNYRVSCIFPGNFYSEGFTEEQKTKPEITKIIEGPSDPISGEDCALIILDKLSKGYDTVTTDFIGWVLSCSTLGMLPRQWGLFQVIVSFVILIFAPVINLLMNHDIKKHYKAKYAKEDKLE